MPAIFPPRKVAKIRQEGAAANFAMTNPIKELILKCANVQIADTCWMFFVTYEAKDIVHMLSKTLSIDKKKKTISRQM